MLSTLTPIVAQSSEDASLSASGVATCEMPWDEFTVLEPPPPPPPHAVSVAARPVTSAV